MNLMLQKYEKKTVISNILRNFAHKKNVNDVVSK